ncbi:flagellar filament capping protein FliD [Salsuginibacillus kocurii]|uniref:flagellar filament capping protein FliD n=1 Tax=Salsuginibacillus kocurii TaxID=427078 RepID=UPI000361F554|nr:flagellar filament capping protein FliD [Salsuginibacillus kocurii]
MRMAGFASGMDIDSMVNDLMQVERQPLERIEQDMALEQLKIDAYREVNTQFNDLRTNLFDTVMMRSNMVARDVTSTDADRVSAEVTGSSSDVSYSISAVDQLASEASASSAQSLTTTGSIDPDASFADQDWQGEAWQEGYVVRESISGETNEVITLDGEAWDEDSLDELVVDQDGLSLQVVTDGSDIEEGQVGAQVVNGALELTFHEAPGDETIEIQGIATHGSEHFEGREERTELELARGGIVAENVEVFVGDSTTALNVVTDPDAELGAGDVFVDAESGEMVLGEATAEDVHVQFTEEYAAGSVTTYNEDGEPQEARFLVSGDDAFDDVLDRLNDADIGVSAFYDDYSDRLSVTRNDTGVFNEAGEEIEFSGALFTDFLGLQNSELATGENDELVIADGTGAAMDWELASGTAPEEVTFEPSAGGFAGVLSDENGVLANEELIVDGEVVGHTDEQGRLVYNGLQGAANAQFTINGLETERRSNTFEVGDVELTLNDTFEAGSAPVRLETSIQTDDIFETIEGFVEEYNEMLEDVHGRLQEQQHRDYPPLTDEQRRELTDHEAELWDERAESGVIRNDSLVRGVMTNLRVDLYTPVEGGEDGAFRILSEIGITTSNDYMERGKLEIDEEALRGAINEDPDGVFHLFAANGDDASEQGFARRMRDTLDGAIDNLAERAGGFRGNNMNHQFALGRNIDRLEEEETRMEQRFDQLEDRYWREFGAMERAMAQAQEQANMFYSAMFG